MEADLAIGLFALIRLVTGFATIGLAGYYRRWIVLLYGVTTVALSVPVAAIALDAKVAELPLITIVALHALQAAFVLGAMLSSAGQVRRLRQVIAAAGIPQEDERWRP